MSELPIVDELRADLLAAMRAAEAPRRRPVTRPRALRPLLLAALLLVLLAATAAAATFYVLRASPIAPFAPRDTVPEQRVATGSSRVLDLRAADPDAGAPPWALRLARSQTGLLCGTVGQADGGEFGIVGLDGRFRVLPEANADSCGLSVPGEPALLGTRVFDSEDDGDVRTVVNGVAEGLESVTIGVRGGPPEAVEASPEGAFLRAFAGFPEDLQPVVTLRFADDRRRRYELATSPFVVPDPLGGRAWKFEAGVIGTRIEPGDTAARDLPQHSCVTFGTSRYRTATSARSPGLCGHSRYGRTGPDRTLFYGARRLSGDRRFTRGLYEGAWNGHPPRTALWGNASRDLVRELVVIEPGGRRHSVRPAVNGAFLVVLDPKVDPAALRVELRFNDGRVQRTGPRRDLVDPEAIG